MSRSPNDDRSDTMNPNNDAYWADQENRFGEEDAQSGHDDDTDSHPAPSSTEPSPHSLQALLDPGLGAATRYRSIDLAALRWDFEIALATPASEERDRVAATAELLRIAKEILEVASDAANRQELGGQVLTADDGVELLLNDGRSLRMVRLATERMVEISGSSSRLFEYGARSWHELEGRTNQWNYSLKLVRKTYGSEQPLMVLIDCVKRGLWSPSLTALRKDIAQRASSDRWRDVGVLQAKIKRVLPLLPEPLRIPSWEDDWTLGSPRGPAAL